MARDCKISQALLNTQADIFRIACDPLRYNLTLDRIASLAGIPYSTLRTYASGQCEMPVSAIYKLTGVIDDELLSLLLPDGRVIVRKPIGIDYDDFASGCLDYAAEHARARHPESECGVDIGPTEHTTLSAKVVRLRA